MTDVDKVALWVGLIGSVAGIVLSIVATVLSIVSNNRATEVNNQTIKSLQKIESAVERLSDDSRTLIKAGWEKMLGAVSPATTEADTLGNAVVPPEPLPESAIVRDSTADTDIAESLAKAKAELLMEREVLRQKLESLNSRRTASSQSVDELVARLGRLSPNAQALFEVISSNGHLTAEQFKELESSRIGPELAELIQGGLVTGLTGLIDNEESSVFWLPSRFARSARVALQLAPKLPSRILDRVREVLRGVGYQMHG